MADRPLRPATDRRLGGPLPRQQANRPRAHPRSEAEATFSPMPEGFGGHPVLAPVSRSYPGTEGRLPTCYSPVRRFPQPRRAGSSLDLHVLSAPPAFVLSQDQTLREEGLSRRPEGRLDSCFRMSLELKVSAFRGRLTGFLSSAALQGERQSNLDAIRGPPWDPRIAHAVEFSKTEPSRDRRKKASDSRQRPHKRRY